MSDISKFAVDGNEYNFKDSEARSSISAINSELSQTEKKSGFINITEDFDNGTFSNNLASYNTGNYIVKTYNNVTYAAVLAHYDYYYNEGKSDYANVNSHHWIAVVMGFGEGKMNTTNTTSGGFKGSTMNTWLKGDCATAVKGAFGTNHLISHSCILTTGTYSPTNIGYDGTNNRIIESNSPTDGFSWSWDAGEYAMIMTEQQLYGTTCFCYQNWEPGEATRPLKLFKDKSFMEVLGHNFGQSHNNFNTYNCWLRNISSYLPGIHFCFASCSGNAGYGGASNSYGRFPIIILK